MSALGAELPRRLDQLSADLRIVCDRGNPQGGAPNIDLALLNFPDARAFQLKAIQSLRTGRGDGHRVQMVLAPTGSGKTILAMFLILEALKKGKRVIFVADRRTLINQTSEVACSLGLISHGVLMAKHWRFNPGLPFQIASAQTLARRNWPDADLIIIDEAHTQLKAWTEHIPHCRATVIGLSATPFSNGLGLLFTNLVNATTMAELTESGVLVPMRVLSCTRVDMGGAAIAGGEWTVQAAGERGMQIIGDVVHEWLKHAENRKTIVFGATIAHCEAMARGFNNAGVMAAVFTAETNDAERKVLLEEFKKPDSMIRVLVSVEALAKGFDVPDVGCVCDVRPLRKSLSTAIQMWGRGLRASPGTSKADMLLLDFSGNILRFSEDFEEFYHHGLDSLDMGEKLDKAVRKDKQDDDPEPSSCPGCGYKPFKKRCMCCGFEIVKECLIEHEFGEMVEYRIGKLTVGPAAEVWAQCVTVTRQSGNPATAPARAAYLYKSITGSFPRNLPDFADVASVTVSIAVKKKARANHIAYRKARK